MDALQQCGMRNCVKWTTTIYKVKQDNNTVVFLEKQLINSNKYCSQFRWCQQSTGIWNYLRASAKYSIRIMLMQLSGEKLKVVTAWLANIQSYLADIAATDFYNFKLTAIFKSFCNNILCIFLSIFNTWWILNKTRNIQWWTHISTDANLCPGQFMDTCNL